MIQTQINTHYSKENFFSHLPMGVTPSENTNIPLLRKFISESVFFFKKLTYFGSSFPKTLFRKFTSEILRFLQIYQNTPPPPIIYPKSKQKVAKAKICANRIPKLHQGSNHTAKQHSKALNPNTL